MSRWVVIAGLVLVLALSNYTIVDRQAIVDHGELVLLELRPVDPRSLMQGDYMVLRYAERVFPPYDPERELPDSGAFVIRLDESRVAGFSRLDDGSPLADDERLLRFKQVDANGTIKLGAESFFFQEGLGDSYARARYGALHVDAAGTSLLVGLADENKRLIDPGQPD